MVLAVAVEVWLVIDKVVVIVLLVLVCDVVIVASGSTGST